jgi:hypothetical protein
MEQFICQEVFDELRGWAAEKAPLHIPDQPKFGRQMNRVEVFFRDGKLIAEAVVGETVMDELRLR